MTFCNSLRDKHEALVARILNFASVLSIYQTEATLDLLSFQLRYLNRQPGFCFQSDGHSYGPYVCLMVKSVLLGEKIRFEPHRGRLTIVNDIVQQHPDFQTVTRD